MRQRHYFLLASLSIAFMGASMTAAEPVLNAPDPQFNKAGLDATAMWSAINPNTQLRTKAPKVPYIQDEKTWADVWTAWRPGEAVPKVDFKNELILLALSHGPNRAAMRVRSVDAGHVQYLVMSTRRGGPGFGYTLVKVNRKGINQVNGVALNKSANNKAEYIRVEVKGTLETGIVAIGGETTGTRIKSGGVTWELQLDEKQRALADALDGETILVKGDLKRVSGVEIRERWIVSVSELKPSPK